MIRKKERTFDTDGRWHAQLELATTLQKHELLEMRRVAGTLYNKNKRCAQALELAKKDKLYKDAMVTAATSQVCRRFGLVRE